MSRLASPVPWILAATLVGCGSDDVDTYRDITGPFTGTARRYVVDDIRLPMTNSSAREIAADIDGDGHAENQLGQTIAALGSSKNVTQHAVDIIRAGAIASSVVLHADDLVTDPRVGVGYFGFAGADATLVGGTLDAGVFSPNPIALTAVPGAAQLVLPVFVDAMPSQIDLVAMDIELVPDGDGFVATIHGVADYEQVLAETVRGMTQLLAARPEDHRLLMNILDANKDWVASDDEIRTNSLFESLLAPDVKYDGVERLSFGFQVHLKPCESGSCSEAPPQDTCHDTVLDGDETDIDCGGSCRVCMAGERCTSDNDCDSGACDGGLCRAPTCEDGRRDGWETDVDCGGSCGATCAIGARCWSDTDCASGQCGEPCTDPESINCIDLDFDYDTCRPAP